jgi:hypothetical protein
MKNAIVMSVAFLVFMSLGSMQVNAQESKSDAKTNRVPLKKLEGTQVSEQSKIHFATDFGNVPDVQWKRSANFDEAVFTKNGKKTTAWYDSNEKLVGTTSEVSFTDLPADGQKAVKTKYKDYTIGKVIFFDDNELNETDMILYNQQFDDADNYFVELVKVKSTIIVRVNTRGEVTFFKQL